MDRRSPNRIPHCSVLISSRCKIVDSTLEANDISRRWTGGREAEGAGLENRYTVTPYREFESHPVRESECGIRNAEGVPHSGSAFRIVVEDGWPSGLRRTPGKRVDGQPSREFESRPIRWPRDEDYPRAGLSAVARGRRSVKVLPWPRVLSTVRSPCMTRASSRLIANPNPVPRPRGCDGSS